MGYVVYIRQELASPKKKKKKKKNNNNNNNNSVEVYFEIFIDNHRSSHCAHSQ